MLPYHYSEKFGLKKVLKRYTIVIQVSLKVMMEGCSSTHGTSGIGFFLAILMVTTGGLRILHNGRRYVTT